MSTYIERHELVNDGTFRSRLEMALWIAATDVINEPVGTPNHTARLAWANKMLKGTVDADKMLIVAIRVTANPSIGASGAEAPDSDIQYVVNGLVDVIA